MNAGFFLGIDLGTTSVKACLVDASTKAVVSTQKKDTQSTVPSRHEGVDSNKQDVPKICSSLHMCVSRLPREKLQKVTCIGVSGQMHGVLLWKSGEAWHREHGDRYDINAEKVSHLYTWQDTRCTSEFLSQLPIPNSHLGVNAGYGCATIFWLQKFKPSKLEDFDRAGTIQDFVVSMLCNLDNPIMTRQNAASWGYFNTETNTWNREILDAVGFPTHLLPKVVKAGTCAGTVHGSWYGIQEGTVIGAALGDCQTSVYSALQDRDDRAVLNLSTSAQLGFIMPKDFIPPTVTQSTVSAKSMEYFPYFDGGYLAVAASMNGGNTLAAFVQMLQQWTVDLGFNAPQSKIWERVVALGISESSSSNLRIEPTLYQERHECTDGATVTHLTMKNLALGKVFHALCKGVVENIHSMMPQSVLESAGISEIVCCGNALLRNPILQELVREIYGAGVSFEKGGDSAFGAALVAERVKLE